MYKVIKEFHFDAGHRVWNHDMARGTACDIYSRYEGNLSTARHKCANLHGHTFFVEVHIESKDIDEQGMVVDTDLIAEVVRQIIVRLDHSMILHKDDPAADRLREIFDHESIVLIDFMPTAEGLARFFYEEIKRQLEGGLSPTTHIKRIVVRISTSIRGVYEGEE